MTFEKDAISLNLTDFRVFWHKMSKSSNSNQDLYVEDLDDVDDDSEYVDCADTLIIKNDEEKNTYRTLLEALLGGVKQKQESRSSSNSNIQQTKEQLIEQIDLFNKYNRLKINDLTYEHSNNNNDLLIKGLIKINWNIKKPIKLVNESVIPINFEKTTSEEVQQEKTSRRSYDDSNLYGNTELKGKNLYRSNTVYHKGRALKRPSRHINNNNQYFIPSYNSVSAIHIDSTTTCDDAIKILFEKYHVTNATDDYALYKILQTGEKKELDASEIPILHRLRMGPFDEDKLFIMEKGVQINTNIDLENLLRLPQNLLNGLLENIKREEVKELEKLHRRYFSYQEKLLQRLRGIEPQYEFYS